MIQFETDVMYSILNELTANGTAEPSGSYLSPQQMQQEFDFSISESGKDAASVFASLKQIAAITPKTAAKNFFNQLFGGRIAIATVADMLVSILNNSMYTYKVAGAQIFIEEAVLDKMRGFVGFKNGEGIFAPGGSISNMVGMMIARNEKIDSIRNSGVNGQKLITYTSDQSHYSIRKNAGILGMGRDNVRDIPSDANGKMDVEALRKSIEADKAAGFVPFFINATAGTTVSGNFDPIKKIAEVAKAHDLWLHVDGAWGGSLLLSEQTRHFLEGCQLADSFTWNAHKMMGVPLSASAILLKKKGLLEKHFSEQADYLFQSEDSYNPGNKSIQCGRRNDALKVWAAWQFFGDKGYEERINKLYDLTQYAVSKIKNDDDLELGIEPESMNVCFMVKGKSSEEICDLLDKRGILKVGHGKFKGLNYIRLICVNADMSYADLDHFFEQVKVVGVEV